MVENGWSHLDTSGFSLPGDGALHLLPSLGRFEDALALGDPELEDGVAAAGGLAAMRGSVVKMVGLQV